MAAKSSAAAPSVTASQFDTVALLLQGGGALGSYQAGVYEALARAQVTPNWIAGISIGAINTALIVGNPEEKRVERLREFWETVSEPPLGLFGVHYNPAIAVTNEYLRVAVNQTRAFGIAALGAPGFFKPRFPPSNPLGAADPAHLSLYDVSPVKATLERLVDFDQINSGPTRMSVGAVNVRTGDFVYFDTTTHRIDVRHVLASGSLPPGFPATEIDGEYYWDGGIVSNTPLQWVLDAKPHRDTLAFQVDLWNAQGELPRDFTAASVRQKDIQFASRSHDALAQVLGAQRFRHAFRNLYRRLPAEMKNTPEAELLASESHEAVYNIVQLTYRSRSYEGIAKDYEFSRRTMEEHWRAGLDDASRALSHPETLRRPENIEGFSLFDFSQPTDR